MSHHQIGRCASLAAVLLLLALVTSALPVGQSGGGDELESLPEPLRMLLLQRLLETRPGEQRPLSPEAALIHDLVLLAHAAASDRAFHHLDIPASSIKTYCHLNNNRQCREACLHLGDSACIDGNISANGNDNAFLESGFHPGK